MGYLPHNQAHPVTVTNRNTGAVFNAELIDYGPDVVADANCTMLRFGNGINFSSVTPQALTFEQRLRTDYHEFINYGLHVKEIEPPAQTVHRATIIPQYQWLSGRFYIPQNATNISITDDPSTGTFRIEWDEPYSGYDLIAPLTKEQIEENERNRINEEFKRLRLEEATARISAMNQTIEDLRSRGI